MDDRLRQDGAQGIAGRVPATIGRQGGHLRMLAEQVAQDEVSGVDECDVRHGRGLAGGQRSQQGAHEFLGAAVGRLHLAAGGAKTLGGGELVKPGMELGRQSGADGLKSAPEQPLAVPVALPLGRRVEKQGQVGRLGRVGHDAAQRRQVRLQQLVDRAIFVRGDDRGCGHPGITRPDPGGECGLPAGVARQEEAADLIRARIGDGAVGQATGAHERLQAARLRNVPAVIRRVVLGQKQVIEHAFGQPIQHGTIHGVIAGAPLAIVVIHLVGDPGPQGIALDRFFR